MNYKKIKIAITVFSMLLCIPMFAQGPPGGGGGRRGGSGAPKGGKPDASEILKVLDANNDDLIDKDEASKAERGKISQDFDTIDSNEDGFIDLEELESFLDSSKPKKVSAEKLL